MGVPSEVSDKLLKLPEASAVALRLQAEQYFDAIQGMVDLFAKKKDLDVIYVTTTVPAQSIVNALVKSSNWFNVSATIAPALAKRARATA